MTFIQMDHELFKQLKNTMNPHHPPTYAPSTSYSNVSDQYYPVEIELPPATEEVPQPPIDQATLEATLRIETRIIELTRLLTAAQISPTGSTPAAAKEPRPTRPLPKRQPPPTQVARGHPVTRRHLGPLQPKHGSRVTHYHSAHITAADAMKEFKRTRTLFLKPDDCGVSLENEFVDATYRLIIQESYWTTAPCASLQRQDTIDLTQLMPIHHCYPASEPNSTQAHSHIYIVECTQLITASIAYIRLGAYNKEGQRAYGYDTAWPNIILCVHPKRCDVVYPIELSFQALLDTKSHTADWHPRIRKIGRTYLDSFNRAIADST